MTRIGVITDAHANLPALEAALDALHREQCDQIIHCGDAIGIGPHPAEVLEKLLSLPNATLLMGNHDALFARRQLENPPPWLSPDELEHQGWTQNQLDDSLRHVVAAWPMQVVRPVGHVHVTFTHYAHSGEAWSPIAPANAPEELDAIFQPATSLVVFGHHHPRADVTGIARYVNPGALGCNPSEGARYAVLSSGPEGVEVSFSAAPYDPTETWIDLIDRAVPEADFIRSVFLN